MKISASSKICMIIGDPVSHSLSPAMHNAAYEKQKIDDEFVFVASNVKIENIKHLVSGMRAINIHGLTCTIPHKVEIMKYLDEIDPVAKKIGAVNTVLNKNGKLIGYNTDWLGITIPLEKKLKSKKIKDLKVALIGAGGASRAVSYAITSKKGKLTIFNRTIEKALKIAKEIDNDIEVKKLSDLEKEGSLHEFDVIINSTNLGMGSLEGISPISENSIESHHIVFDIVYKPKITKLLSLAKKKGASIIYGWEMLLYQGTAQYEIYTGKKAPEETMKEVLLNN